MMMMMMMMMIIIIIVIIILLHVSLGKSKQLSNSSHVLLGNFNLPDIDWNAISPFQPNQLSNFFCDCIVNCFGLMQVVDSPTRSESILDLTLTDSFESITVLLYWPISLGSSDHRIINFTFITKVGHPLQPSKVVFYYKNPNWNSFRTELTSGIWDSVFANNNINVISGTDGNVFSTKPFATTSLQ